MTNPDVNLSLLICFMFMVGWIAYRINHSMIRSAAAAVVTTGMLAAIAGVFFRAIARFF